MKFRKIILTAITIALSSPMVVLAENNNESQEKEYSEHVFEFADFAYTEEADLDNKIILYENLGNSETYMIKDADSGLISEKITVTYEDVSPQTIHPDAHTAYFTRDKYYNGAGTNAAVVRFTAAVMYYSSGSFREFEQLEYTNVNIISSVCMMTLENVASNAWSHTGNWPCTQLDYSYTGTLCASTDAAANFTAVLVSAGFSKTSYYYLFIQDSGSFRCYA